MRLEDWPPLSTQPIGVQADGTVVELYPPDLPNQLVVIDGPTEELPPPTLMLGAGEPVTEGEALPAGWNLFIPTEPGEPVLFDGGTAPADGANYPISVT